MPSPSWEAEPVAPVDIQVATRCCRATLAPALDRDWSRPAGSLGWSCRDTLDHTCDAVGSYVRQLATRSPTQRPRFRTGDPSMSVEELLDVVDTLGTVLRIVAEAAPPDARAHHAMGMADAEGFVAMGCVEVLVHTWDIARGLDLTVDPPVELTEKLLNRLFPWAPVGHPAWETFLYSAGRTPLGDLPHQHRAWGWHARPRAEWPGGPSPRLFTG